MNDAKAAVASTVQTGAQHALGKFSLVLATTSLNIAHKDIGINSQQLGRLLGLARERA